MNKYFIFVLLLIFSVSYYFTHIPRLHNDLITTDAVYWHHRSEKFVNGLVSGDYLETFQKYHPGVTLMWLMSLTAVSVSNLTGQHISQVFDNFVAIDFYTKLVFVCWQFLLSILLLFLLNKILKTWLIPFFVLLLLNLEPFYVGNSRLIHHDAPISLYVLIGIGFAFLFLQKSSVASKLPKSTNFLIIFSAFFLALAALSKTLFVGAFLFVLAFTNLYLYKQHGLKKCLSFTLILVSSYLIFYYSLFPALWVDPFGVIRQIILESYDTSEGTGHIQILFGNENRDPGALFYILLLVTKTSLVTSLGILLFIISIFISLIKRIKPTYYDINFISFISIFYLTFFLVICYFEKKVDRYVIPLYPYLVIISVFGWYWVTKFVSSFFTFVLILLLGSFTIIYPLFSVFPHYLTYVNPVFGNAEDSNKIIGQKLFGIGIFDLNNKIIEHFGDSTSVAINDIGPLSSIYTKGRVYNVLSEHPNSYNVLVLGPNKDLPKSVKEEKSIGFKHIDSVYINGLEFWRIYKKYYK